MRITKLSAEHLGLTTRELMELSGLNFTYEKAPVLWRAPMAATAETDAGVASINPIREMKSRDVIYRSDTMEALCTYSKNVHMHNPEDIVDFFRGALEDTGWHFHSLGCNEVGDRIWAKIVNDDVLTLGANLNPKLNDIVARMMLLSSGLKVSTKGKDWTERLICLNGMTVRDYSTNVSITHMARFDPEYFRNELFTPAMDLSWAKFCELANELADRPIGLTEARGIVVNLFEPKDREEGEDLSTRTEKKVDNVIDLFGGKGRGAKLPASRGTRWGLLNAVTEFVDHHTGARSEETRRESSMFGRGNAIKMNAAELLAA